MRDDVSEAWNRGRTVETALDEARHARLGRILPGVQRRPRDRRFRGSHDLERFEAALRRQLGDVGKVVRVGGEQLLDGACVRPIEAQDDDASASVLAGLGRAGGHHGQARKQAGEKQDDDRSEEGAGVVHGSLHLPGSRAG